MDYLNKDGVKLLSIPFEGGRYVKILRYNPHNKNDVKFPTKSDLETLYNRPTNDDRYTLAFDVLMESVIIPCSSMKPNKVDFIPILANTLLSATYKDQFDTPFFNKRSVIEVKISQEIKKAEFNYLGARIYVESEFGIVVADSSFHFAKKKTSGKTLYVQGPYSLAIADLDTGKLCFMQKITNFDSLVGAGY